jgi:hypothetical protein
MIVRRTLVCRGVDVLQIEFFRIAAMETATN